MSEPCMDIKIVSGERMCCHRTKGHRSLHADQNEAAELVEWA